MAEFSGIDGLTVKEDSLWGVLGCGFPGKERLLRLWEAMDTSQFSLHSQHFQPDSLMFRDEEDTARPEKAQPSLPAGKMSKPFLQLAQDPTVPTYKQGILARKMHQDADGKKSECLLPTNRVACWERPCSGTCADACTGVQRDGLR